MIVEILALTGIGVAAYTVADHENVLPWAPNPLKQFWWERPPFAQLPAARARFNNQPIQFQPVQTLSPRQELSAAQRGVVYADQLLSAVSRKYPHLAVTSKYVVTP